jgi:hypothetical protein
MRRCIRSPDAGGRQRLGTHCPLDAHRDNMLARQPSQLADIPGSANAITRRRLE